jgi:predicted nucleic acid-binding protein
MIVVDATVWVDLLRGMLPEHLVETIASQSCVSPPHVDFEVGSALLRAQRRGILPAGRAADLVSAFSTMPMARVRHPADPVHALSFLGNTSYADALYLATAARLGCPLLTLDKDLADAAAIHDVPVTAPAQE